MSDLSSYQIHETLYQGMRTEVYRGLCTRNDQLVIIKVLRNPHPNVNELINLRHQYVITRHLEHAKIVKPLALESYGNGYALVMPDSGSIALSDYWQQCDRTLQQFLDLAIQLAEVLHYLHQQRIIHNDIKPANILIHPQTHQIQLIDFSLSSLLPQHQQQRISPNGLDGTLADISPEQTKPMNPMIDYRTDFYALGVTFYELLTGELPLNSDDPMRLVHSHIAKMPILGNGEYTTDNNQQHSSSLHAPIPQVLIDIVLKLMAKNAEDRYQNALGLKHDLEQCLQQFQSGNSLSYPHQTSTQTTNTVTASPSSIDLASAIKASQAISQEMSLEALLSKFMQIIAENVDADRAAILLNNSGNWHVAGWWDHGTYNRSSNVFDPPNSLPQTIINTVKRTQTPLLLNNVPEHKSFSADPYLSQKQPLSLVCTPILHSGKIVGLLYLENNLITDAFTPDQIELLNLLTSQAAISIENARLYHSLEDYNRNLEQKVTERTQALAQALEELKTTQDELIQKEKMAALGQLIAGVAHEINTPLGAIRSSARTIAKFLDQTLEQLPTLFQSLSTEDSAIFLALLQRSLQHQSTVSTKEERKLKRTLRRELENSDIADADIIAEKLVIMGITDEIASLMPLLHRPDSFKVLEIAYKLSELKRGTAMINTSTDRASKVVFALKTYSRYNQSGEKISVNLTEGIETVLTLYHNQLKQGVEVIRNYAEIPPVSCYPDELSQVWTNLIHNALQAMDNRGTLTIDVTQENQQAKISITDSGCGIPEDIKQKIFQPFFTTKPTGEGSGLGLDIVKKIMDKHSGNMTVESQPGRTTFNVFIPIQS
ncbi:MAG: protein kinase [Coleofasciculus sp. C1-SOL-03]